jgi:hypothetical protein
MTGRSAARVLAAFAVTGAAAPTASPRLDVAASCERKAAKGRVLCDVEFEIQEGRIAWADVIVVQAPAFARPLRSRVGTLDARSRTDRRIHIPVAFVARDQGRGTVGFRGRAVVCAPGAAREACAPVTHDVAVELKVGAEER